MEKPRLNIDNDHKIVCLAGGVGAARFLEGLFEVINPSNLTIVVNTGDDITIHGLHISPDIDIVIYTLAGIVDSSKGWGITGDSFRCLEMLGRYGYEPWFNLGDMDLATHINRSEMLSGGSTLVEVTETHRRALGVKPRILPMTNQRFETYIETKLGVIHFQEYLVKRKAQDDILGIRFLGQECAEPAPGVLDAIHEADIIVICPSNPVVSISTILSVRGIRESINSAKAVKAAVSPIIAGATVKGPADKMLRATGYEASALGIAKYYAGLIDLLVIDEEDAHLKPEIEKTGVRVHVTDTIMRDKQAKIRLAYETITEAAKQLSRP